MKLIPSYNILKEKHIIFNLYPVIFLKTHSFPHYQDNTIWMDNLGMVNDSFPSNFL